jgi:hypothetical protein
MKRKNDGPRATVPRGTVAKRAGGDGNRKSEDIKVKVSMETLSKPPLRETRPVRHEKGRQGFALADR